MYIKVEPNGVMDNLLASIDMHQIKSLKRLLTSEFDVKVLVWLRKFWEWKSQGIEVLASYSYHKRVSTKGA